MRHVARSLAVLAVTVAVLNTLAPRPASAETHLRQTTISAASIPPEVKQDFGAVRQGELAVLEITVANPLGEVLTIGAVQPLCACMNERSDRTIQPGAKGTVRLELETDDYSGAVTEAALIQWTNAPVAVTRVEMTLEVKPVLEVLPKRLIRFRTTQGQGAEEVVELRSATGAAFRVTGVETSAAYLTASASPSGPHAHRLTVTLGPDAPAGMLRHTVTVHTDLPTLPSVKLNVTGVVAAAPKSAGTAAGASD